ncbi:MAG TPA: serine protease [Ornithinibacter sp.]|nr:serine protease [Ornithinibacter sp.]
MTFVRSTTARLVGAMALLASSVLGAAVATAPAASAAPTWAPAATATITPGVQMYTDGAQCTGNFVFTDSADNVYVGYAAHCAGLGSATDTNGCLNESVPLGTTVTFNQGGSLISSGTQVGTGTLAYSSWRTMRTLGTPTSSSTCAYNDFALVKVSTADKGKVNPSIPFWGGPTGIDTDGTAAGDRVYSYGNSSLRGGLTELSPKTGISLGDDAADEGWSHPLYTLTPGIPGDSGSAFVSADGKAVGTLSTLGLAPLPASNNIGDLAKELAFAQQHSGISGLKLELGTEPFDPIL